MPERRFLCLAVSRRESGNCIAGIDIDSGEWLRPIHSQARPAFADFELVVEDNHTHQTRFMALLDLLWVPLQENAGTGAQPENWIVEPRFLENPRPILRKCIGRRTVQLLLSHVDHGDLLLNSSRDSVASEECAQGRVSRSLSLVRPVDLAWNVTPHAKHPGRTQVRAEFRLGKAAYSLVVTDPIWEARCEHAGIGRHTHAHVASPGNDLVFLTISLAAVAYHGLHYKLVAGVIELRSFEQDTQIESGQL